jgi:carbonic anhydrase
MQNLVKSVPRFVALAMLSVSLSACVVVAGNQVQPKPQVQTEVMSRDRQQQITPDMAVQLLKDGNARFVAGNLLNRDVKNQVRVTGEAGQFPFASIVSCIDSRAAPTQIFDLGVGDVFSARVAGNIVNEDILGSLEYASRVAGAKLIVILGHSHCGAVKGACDDVKLGNLTQLLTKIRPAVNVTPDQHGTDRSSANHHFVDAVALTNVRVTMQNVLEKSAVLREMSEKGQIKIVGAMLDVETGEVQFL